MVYLINKTGLLGMGEENERKGDILFQLFSYTIHELTISWATKLREQSWVTLSINGDLAVLPSREKSNVHMNYLLLCM